MPKQLRCPFCGAAETLNYHSRLLGNDPASAQGGQVQRGQRVWCSNRGQRGGCGRSFSVFPADVLPGHTVRAPALWSLLERLLEGSSIKAAFESLGLAFALERFYHLVQRLRGQLARLRSVLSPEQKPPANSQADPLLQSVEHLRDLFGSNACPVADFQVHFQRPLLQ